MAYMYSPDDIAMQIAQWELASPSEQREIVEALGRNIPASESDKFEDFLRYAIPQGILDVTDWSRHALRSALRASAGLNLNVTFKYGERRLAPVTYPQEGPLLEMFVEAIMTGKWQ
jgi:hypothetical protein